MQTIGDLIARDLSQTIEEVVKLDQQDEQTVLTELREYITTARIRQQFHDVLKAVADAPSDPTEGVGVWVSGFFGSGKSSFAKNLGYILANRLLLGTPASQVFLAQLQKQAPPNDSLVRKIDDLVQFILARFHSQVIMFDVQKDRDVRRSSEPIAQILYTVLLRTLDYATDYDLAELEIDLEAESRLATFVQTCAELYRDQVKPPPQPPILPATLPGVATGDWGVWQRVRAGSERIARTSAVMHRLDPITYPEPESWSRSIREGDASITVKQLVDRTFDLTSRRRPGHAVFFIVDEVGGYVARSAEKIEDLRAVVEQFGQEGKNRVLAGKVVAPTWVIVTSQEKLDEVVAAIGDKRVDLARLQDRFKLRIDMVPGDISEVATKRVLAKKDAAIPVLQRLYDDQAALLRTHTRMERTSRPLAVSRDEFVQFYPYLPYLVNLSIDIATGTRIQSEEAPRQIGGSNRTIIKQAYEMLAGPRTGLANQPVGALVTLDRIYDLVENNLPTAKRKDMTDIEHLAGADPWTLRTAKAIAMLEYVRDLPRTPVNIAALLYGRLGEPSPQPMVEAAIAQLEKAQFIRQTEEGWKLQTAQEKNWTVERNTSSITPREENELLAEMLGKVLGQTSLSKYNYEKLRTFNVGITWNGRTITSGAAQIPLLLNVADDPGAFAADAESARDESRLPAHQNDLFWVFALNTDLDALLLELHRSRRMVSKYDQLRAQNKISGEESASLAQERQEAQRIETRLIGHLERALAAGRGFFRGVQKDAAGFGASLTEVLKGLFDYAVPDLYPNLKLGARPLTGKEAEELLKAANLNGLSKIFYAPPDGLSLVVIQDAKPVINLQAPIVKEVSAYLQREHAYGNKVTGRAVENHFGGIGYGWEPEILWLVLATLLRSGAIEVTYQGKRYRNHLDPQVRAPFSGPQAFRSASFAPRKSIDLPTLVAAAKRYEELTGEEVDVEESAIAAAFQKLARNELEALLPVMAVVQANQLPVADVLADYQNTLKIVLASASDDAVNMLAGEGASFQRQRDQVAAIRRATDDKGLARIRRLRSAERQLWPALQAEGNDGELADAVTLIAADLQGLGFVDPSVAREQALTRLETAYADLYAMRHKRRQEVFQGVVDDLRGQPDWVRLSPELEEQVLAPFMVRVCTTPQLAPGQLRCGACAATLAEMSADLAAVDRMRSDALLQLQKLIAPEEKVERVSVARIVGSGKPLATVEDLDQVLGALRDHLAKLIAAGVKIMLE